MSNLSAEALAEEDNQFPTANRSAEALAKADFQVTYANAEGYLEIGSWSLDIQF